MALLLRSSETRPLFARFVRLDPPGSNPPLPLLASQRYRGTMHTLNSHRVPTPDCPFGGLIEESLGADRAVVSLTHGHPSLQGLCNPSRDSAQGCEGGRAGCRSGRYRSTALAAGAAATGALHRLQVRSLQEHCTGCRCSRYRSTPLPPVAGACYRGMPCPCSSRAHGAGCRCSRYRSTLLPPVAGACYRGMPCPCSSRAHGAGCRCSRYRSTPLAPVAGACYRGMRTPVAAGPRRWLQVRSRQEH